MHFVDFSMEQGRTTPPKKRDEPLDTSQKTDNKKADPHFSLFNYNPLELLYKAKF